MAPRYVLYGLGCALFMTIQALAAMAAVGTGDDFDQLLQACDGVPLTPEEQAQIEGDNERQVVFVVTPSGAVLRRPDRSINEKDEVVIYVRAAAKVFEELKVRRSSPIRVPGTVNLGGASVSLPPLPGRGPAVEPAECILRRRALGDFAEGRGIVEFVHSRVVGEKTKEDVVGSFDFVVHKLYHGILTFGPVATNLPSREFSLVRQGNGQVIEEASTGGRTAYALFASMFLGGARGLDEPRPASPSVFSNLAITVGLPTTDLKNKPFYVGASFYWNHLLVTYGANGEVTKELSPASGLKVGSAYADSLGPIPTQSKLRWSDFWAVSLDLRAALQFVNALLSVSGTSP